MESLMLLDRAFATDTDEAASSLERMPSVMLAAADAPDAGSAAEPVPSRGEQHSAVRPPMESADMLREKRCGYGRKGIRHGA